MTVPYFSTADDPFGDHFDDLLDDEASLHPDWSYDVLPPDLADDDEGELNDDDQELWSRD